MGRGVTVVGTDVERVRARVERWRGERAGRAPMPEELWEEVAGVARRRGVSRVARELGLDYGSLKKRVLEGSGPKGDGGGGCGGFVEMDAAGLAGVFGPGGAVVEIWEPDGTRLVVRLAEGEGPDVAALVAAFRGRGAR